MSVVTLQIGQCGNQLGCSLFDALVQDPEGAPVFFREASSGGAASSSSGRGGETHAGDPKRPSRKRYTARAVLIDMESKVGPFAPVRRTPKRTSRGNNQPSSCLPQRARKHRSLGPHPAPPPRKCHPPPSTAPAPAPAAR